MFLELKKATLEDIPLIHSMAAVAFPDAYKDILTPEQTEYMMDMMYSERNLRQQMESGHVYFIAYSGETPCGYVSVERQGDKLFHLQKIYVMPEWRGKGVGGFMFAGAVKHVKFLQPEKCTIELNVNRNNKALEFYKHLGMQKVRQGDFDIGGGFYMNDYIMSLEV